jgi:hypothetical protein
LTFDLKETLVVCAKASNDVVQRATASAEGMSDSGTSHTHRGEAD